MRIPPNHPRRVRLIAIFTIITLVLSTLTFWPTTPFGPVQAGSLTTLPADAVVIQPSSGVSFYQVDFAFETDPVVDSDTGQVDVDIAALKAATGQQSGYLNIVTDQGWVVPNLPIFADFAHPGLAARFKIAGVCGAPVPALPALVIFTPNPVVNPPAGPFINFPVGDIEIIEGGTDPVDIPPGPTETPTPTPWSPGGSVTPTATATPWSPSSTPTATATPWSPGGTPTATATPWSPGGTPTTTATPWSPGGTPTTTATPWSPGGTPTTTATPWSPGGTPTTTATPWSPGGTPTTTATPWSPGGTPTSTPTAWFGGTSIPGPSVTAIATETPTTTTTVTATVEITATATVTPSITATVDVFPTAQATVRTAVSRNQSQSTGQVGLQGLPQGGKGGCANAPRPPQPIVIPGNPAVPNRRCALANTANVEAAIAQCGPAAVANSLDWLRRTYGLAVPHAHVPGVRNNSLVGQLDIAMGRGAGQTVGNDTFLVGKLNYIDNNRLGNNLIVEHQYPAGARIGQRLPIRLDANVRSTPGNVTSTWRGNITANFIIDKICAGAAVELVYVNNRYGHVVQVIEAGITNGVPWIVHQSDYNQGRPGVTRPIYTRLADTDRDAFGLLNLVDDANRSNVVLVVSQTFRR